MTYSRKGFTLVEVVVAAAIFSVLVIVIGTLRNNVSTLSNLVGQKLQSRQDIDRVMDQMVTEIRSASPSNQGSYPIESASSSTLVFYSDVDSDGLFEKVRYTVASSSMTRGITKPEGNPLTYATSSERTAMVISNLTRTTSSPVFLYYGEDYTGTQAPLSGTTTLPSDIRMVRVTLYVDVRPREAPKPAYVSQLINIRNLRDD